MDIDIQDLIDESSELETIAAKIQQDENNIALGDDEINAFVERYDQWMLNASPYYLTYILDDLAKNTKGQRFLLA